MAREGRRRGWKLSGLRVKRLSRNMLRMLRHSDHHRTSTCARKDSPIPAPSAYDMTTIQLRVRPSRSIPSCTLLPTCYPHASSSSLYLLMSVKLRLTTLRSSLRIPLHGNANNLSLPPALSMFKNDPLSLFLPSPLGLLPPYGQWYLFVYGRLFTSVRGLNCDYYAKLLARLQRCCIL